MAKTLKDIARLANVSHMTVSRVVNGSDNVSEKTRERVLRIIADHNYIPSVSARALISGKTKMIGILVMYDLSQFPQDFLPAILEGISYALNKQGYSCALFFDQVNGKKNVVPQKMLTRGQIDGLLIASVEKDIAIRKRIQEIDVPVVLVNQRINAKGVGYVVTDDVQGAYEAVDYLIRNGHTNIGFLGGTPTFSTSIERLNGYKKALRKRGIAFDETKYRIGDFNNQKSYEETLLLLKEHPEITAIFAANDAMALGAYRAIGDTELSIPQDISVIGYDNQEYCQFIQPPLTTVRKHRRMMGEQAANLIVAAVENSEEPRKIVLQPELSIRASVKTISR